MNVKFDFREFDILCDNVERLVDSGEEIVGNALYVGAGAIADAIKANIPVKKGELKAAFGVSKFKLFSWMADTGLGFDGYNSKGVPHALIARALESGTSDGRIEARGFIRKAVNKSKAKAELQMQKEMEKQIKEKLEGGL